MPNIFIVDDSISVRKALEITLRNHNMQSRSAISGEQALEILQEQSGRGFDLLMVDVIMPGMSGIDLCARLKEDVRLAHLPVILMSGNVDDEVRQQAKEVGASNVLRKPFRSEELVPMIESVLAEVAPAPATEEPAPLDTGERTETAALHENQPQQAAEARITGEHLDALSELLQTYEDHPRVRDVVILDRQGQPIKQTGNVLPENIQMFARFFTNTAGVLGKQMIGEDIRDVTIRYGEHEMVIHNLPGHFVVVLMSEHSAGLQA